MLARSFSCIDELCVYEHGGHVECITMEVGIVFLTIFNNALRACIDMNLNVQKPSFKM
jgi:hypothetical protein